MDYIQIKKDLIKQLIEISEEAGKAILEVYNSDFDYEIKEDLSPLTKADTLSHEIICEGLKVLTPNIPILSEESSDIPFNIRSSWKQYWLIDPLDGTKEFIKRNGEFTVNIALINNNKPIFGIIHAPVLNQTFWGSENSGSFQMEGKKEQKKITVSSCDKFSLRIVASRSHTSEKLNILLRKIEKYEIIHIGSSLKFCLIASGKADIYPRFGPTSEWDSAAGEAIVRFAGGKVISTNRKSLTYNSKKSYLNPDFIISNDQDLTEMFLDIID